MEGHQDHSGQGKRVGGTGVTRRARERRCRLGGLAIVAEDTQPHGLQLGREGLQDAAATGGTRCSAPHG